MNHVCKDSRVISFYVGNGLKYTEDEFFPKFPYYIHSEPLDREEENEPDQEELPENEENPENLEGQDDQGEDKE